ncbi:MAG: SDR family oxidoreductase [Acidobacteriota bacterium]|nr:SDR family oxidoreductase [Blastocatellia bacterium]MDW8413721.1 SDR family oxidoreductase [Acidobacteriota bacterium]
MKKKVLITGISGGLAHQVATLVPKSWEIVGVGLHTLRAVPNRHIHFHRVDITKNKLEEVFRQHKIDAVIHLALNDNPRTPIKQRHEINVIGTMKLLDDCAKYGVRKVILLSSATVYGADPNNPIYIPEDFPLKVTQRYSELSDKVEFDTYCRAWMYKQAGKIDAILLRPCHIIGSQVKNNLTSYLRLKYIPIPLGYDPMLQIIHETDMARAIIACLKSSKTGIYNVTGPGELPLTEIINILGGIPIPIPYTLGYYALKTSWILGLGSLPAPQLEFLTYPCVIDGSKFRKEFGFEPRLSLSETLLATKL